MYKIYKITNATNGKVYIGLTKFSIEERFRSHIRRKLSNKRLSQAIAKHGEQNFTVALLEEATTLLEAELCEAKWIKYYDSTNWSVGYNMTEGGAGRSMVFTRATRQKMSASINRYVGSLTPEQRKLWTEKANMSKRGIKESSESRKKKSVAQSVRWASVSAEERAAHGQRSASAVAPETRERMNKALLGAYSPARAPGVPKPKVVCPHCGKEGGAPIMGRYHFDNCKRKPA